MAYTEEPDIIKGENPEEQLQRAVKAEVTSILEHKKSEKSLVEYFIIERFGLDIAIFIRWIDSHFSVRFLELKAFIGSRQGGVGFGNQNGEGPQVDLLLMEDQRLNIAEQFIHWVLLDGTRKRGTPRFAMFDNERARHAAMGGVGRRKQNNFRVNELVQKAVTWDEL
jgi:hypothetical protein